MPDDQRPFRRRGEPRVLAGRYMLTQLLGKGGMSAVYVASDLESGRPVAVKLLHPHLKLDGYARVRFATEIRAAKRVDHPNAVRALDDGEHEGVPFLVMEYVAGESLDDYLRREERMPIDLLLTLMRQAARGLAGMHAAGVWHRDVKPSNLLLADTGGGGEPWAVKVADFGLARIGGRSITLQGTALGTTDYMAPEQVVSDEPDPRTDVYALGVVMFRAVTGRMPFAGDSPQQVIARQLLSPAPAPSSLVPDLDAGVERIIVTALRKRPDNRYPTMTDMLKDIERAMGLREGGPRGVECRDDDVYEPQSEAGKEVMDTLRDELAC